jgi:hypothetical protein
MRKLLLMLVLLAAAGCATGYQERNITGGYEETEVRAGVWRVVFAGNGYVTRETVQTYWLYRCAELTLAKGYDGFEVISGVDLASLPAAEGEGRLVPVQAPLVEKPFMAGTIKLAKAPLIARPPRLFDARKLKEKLEPLVKGKACGSNVCPHFHGYLLPDV